MMEILPDKAQYRPGDEVAFKVVAPPGTAKVETEFWELFRVADRVETAAGEPVRWVAPDTQWSAYGVECRAVDAEGRVLAACQTAIDVADHWWRAPRLGFMTDFGAGETLTETQRRIDVLARLHINCLHFYDWFYSHHRYLPPEENFVDPLGRPLSLIAVRRKIRLAQRAGMAALAYGPIYGAEEAFVQEHPDWALYRSDGVPFHVARLFYIMDFRPDSAWTRHILAEYVRAVSELGFDGIQVDQYGYPKRALPYPGVSGGAAIDLSSLFLPFLEQAHTALTNARPGARVVFHALNNWPLRKVADGPQAANYIQVFAPHETYRDLRDLITSARSLAPAKPVIVAAYLKPFQADQPARAEAALQLLTAVIHAAGGFHVILGEGEGVLTEGYFPNYIRLRPEGLEQIRAYYDFIVRYGTLLQAPPEADISETHAGGVTEVFSFEGAPASPMPRPGHVWTVIREHAGLVSMNLVNLTGTATGCWNQGQNEPPEVRGLRVSYKVVDTIGQVLLASPDQGGGRLVSLPFAVEPDPQAGHVLRFTVPVLKCWSLVLVVPE